MLSDLAVYSEYAYSAMTEVLAQQIDLFNAASRGTIILRSAAHQGDYSDVTFFAKISGLIRRRNPYGSGTVAEKSLSNLVDTMVKVAAGTPPVRLDPGQFKWIQQNPEIAGAALGQQLAGDVMADMLNTGLLSIVAALKQMTVAPNVLVSDISGVGNGLVTARAMNTATFLFGDRAAAISAWIMHSTALATLFDNNLANAQMLFTYGTVNIVNDPFGRIFVVSDSPALVDAGSPNKYSTLGLASGALIVDQNNDYTANEETKNGDENIIRTFQAEWSYNLGVKGFSWDKTNGGKAPNDAALATSTNWDKIVTSPKDMAGVLLYHK